MKVLIIEDEKGLCATLKFILESESHEVKMAYDGQMGIDLCMQNSFDWVLTDIVMPVKNGFEVIEFLQKHLKDVGIIAMSGMADEFGDNNLQKAQKLGAKYVLKKPFSPDTLLEILKKPHSSN